jgi:hypothetical protein
VDQSFLFLLAVSLSGAAAAQTPPAADSAKSICKTRTETGSLTKRTRECHTSAEWQRLAEQGRSQAGDYQQGMNGNRAGN